MNHRSVVLEFIVILVTDDGALVVASAAKRATNVDRGISADRVLAIVLAQELKAGLIHDLATDHLGVADLHGVFL